jgi:hypothetical protein
MPWLKTLGMLVTTPGIDLQATVVMVIIATSGSRSSGCWSKTTGGGETVRRCSQRAEIVRHVAELQYDGGFPKSPVAGSAAAEGDGANDAGLSRKRLGLHHGRVRKEALDRFAGGDALGGPLRGGRFVMRPWPSRPCPPSWRPGRRGASARQSSCRAQSGAPFRR